MRDSTRSHHPGWGRIVTAVVLTALALGACGKKPLPALSAIVDAPYLRPGSSWTYKVEDSNWKAPANVTLTYIKDDAYKNAGVLSFTSGPETLLYDRSLNFVSVAKDGRILKVSAVKPRYHGTEDGRWDYRVTIVFKNPSVAVDAPYEEAIKKQLFPDQETFKREEQRRFEILAAHWDVPVVDVELDQSGQ